MKLRIWKWMVGMALAIALVTSGHFAVNGQDQENDDRHAHYVVFDLGTLGGMSSAGNSINNRGWVAGLSSLSGNQVQHATLWRHGMKLDLGALGGPGANSADEWPVKNVTGLIAGISETSTVDPLGETFSCGAFIPTNGHTCLGFLWQNNKMSPLPTLGGNNGFATGVNNRGQAVGWAENAVHDPTCVPPQVLQFEAVIYGPQKGRIRELPPLAGDLDGAATAINDREQVVGISGICGDAVGEFSAAHALLWQDGVPANLGSLGGMAWNTPMAISNRGQIAGFSDLPGDEDGTPNFHAFRWTRETGMQDLGTLPGDAISEATGINDRGQIVGVSFAAGFSSPRAFLWEDGVMTDLNTLSEPGSNLYLIVGGDINDRGEIAGQALNTTTGQLTTFLAIPGPRGHDQEHARLSPQNSNNPGRKVNVPESVREMLMRRLGVWRPGSR